MIALLVVVALVGVGLPLLRVAGRARLARAHHSEALTSVAQLPLPSSATVVLRRHEPRWPVPRAAAAAARS